MIRINAVAAPVQQRKSLFDKGEGLELSFANLQACNDGFKSGDNISTSNSQNPVSI